MIYRHLEGAPEHVHEKAPDRPFADLMRDGFGDGTWPTSDDFRLHLCQMWPQYALAEACSSYEPQMDFLGLTSLRRLPSGLGLPMMRTFVDRLRHICLTLPHSSLRIQLMISPLMA